VKILIEFIFLFQGKIRMLFSEVLVKLFIFIFIFYIYSLHKGACYITKANFFCSEKEGYKLHNITHCKKENFIPRMELVKDNIFFQKFKKEEFFKSSEKREDLVFVHPLIFLFVIFGTILGYLFSFNIVGWEPSLLMVLVGIPRIVYGMVIFIYPVCN